MNILFCTYGCLLISASLLWIGPIPATAADYQSPATRAVAEETSEAGTDEKTSEEDGPDVMERFLFWSDTPHRNFTDRLENLSRSIDSIFGEERIYEEATETYLQLRGGVVYERGGSLSLDHRLRLKIDLPHTEERVKLVFESEDDEEDVLDRTDTDGTKPDVLEKSEDKDYSAALQFFIRETRRWNVSVGPGVRIRNPPDPFARLRIRRRQDLGSTWQTRLTERLTEFLDRGLESLTSLEFERRTGKEQLFRLTSEVLWREEFSNDNVQLSQGAQLFKRLTNRDSIAYGAAVVWETKPNLRHQAYIADIRLRRRIHKKWLYLEIKPQALFERENHFRLDPSITFSVEILFGKRYLMHEENQS